jgi:hypothetical protein
MLRLKSPLKANFTNKHNCLHHQKIAQTMVESIAKPMVSATEADWSREKAGN